MSDMHNYDTIRTTDEAENSSINVEQPVGRLLYYSEIPAWHQENEYVLSGYRPTTGSILGSLLSMTYLSNETINTWSHILGCFGFLYLPSAFAGKLASRASKADQFVLAIYALGVAVCFALSATCHIVWNCSPAAASLGNKLDYLGILVLMWSAGIPTIYYGFCCDSKLRLLYWSLTSIAALGCAIFTLNPTFIHPKFRRWRAVVYAAFGFSSVSFVTHGLVLYGWETQKQRMSLEWMAWMATANVVGAATYAARIPERWFPYRFDFFGASHQIFHVAVIVAALIHYAGLLEALRVVQSGELPCR